MASGTIVAMDAPIYFDCGIITATSQADALGKAWDAIPADKVIIGRYQYLGYWMFMGFKYVGAQYGMMIVIQYNRDTSILELNVNEGTKYYHRLERTAISV